MTTYMEDLQNKVTQVTSNLLFLIVSKADFCVICSVVARFWGSMHIFLTCT